MAADALTCLAATVASASSIDVRVVTSFVTRFAKPIA